MTHRVRSGEESFVFINVEENGLRAVAKDDHEASRASAAQSLDQPAEPPRCVTSGNDFIDPKCWHGLLLVEWERLKSKLRKAPDGVLDGGSHGVSSVVRRRG